MDRLLFLFLILAGFLVLLRRRFRWSQFLADNKCLSVFFIYLGFSIFWADYPFVAFKRWFKDVGNIIIILVIVSEADPIEATKAVFLRCAYLLVPTSILCIKYFPQFGRSYDPFTGTVIYGGATGNKNTLGATLIIYTLVLLWELLQLHDDPAKDKKKLERFTCLLFLAMVAWVFVKSQSATSLVCTLLGAGIIWAMRLQFFRSRMNRMELYVFALAVLLVLLDSVLDIRAIFVSQLGRDMTFSGRTGIWERALSVPINSLIGTGYYSFWLDPGRVAQVSKGYFFKLNEAHSGYIETYLNEGLIGLFLLVTFLISAYRKIKRDVLSGENSFNALRLAFLAIGIVYNLTEAAFDRMDFIWFVLLFAPSPPALEEESRQDQLVPNAAAAVLEGS